MRITYRFSLGDSTDGQVGFCFDFSMDQAARDDQAAVDAVKAAFSEYGTDTCMTGLSILPEPFAGICVYVNEDLITVEDIVHVYGPGIEQPGGDTDNA